MFHSAKVVPILVPTTNERQLIFKTPDDLRSSWPRLWLITESSGQSRITTPTYVAAASLADVPFCLSSSLLYYAGCIKRVTKDVMRTWLSPSQQIRTCSMFPQGDNLSTGRRIVSGHCQLVTSVCM